MAWPNYPVPPDPRPAWQILDEILLLALAAGAPNVGAILWLALQCSANAHPITPHQQGPNPPPTPVQDAHVTAALDAARAGQWDVVQRELDHD